MGGFATGNLCLAVELKATKTKQEFQVSDIKKICFS